MRQQTHTFRAFSENTAQLIVNGIFLDRGQNEALGLVLEEIKDIVIRTCRQKPAGHIGDIGRAGLAYWQLPYDSIDCVLGGILDEVQDYQGDFILGNHKEEVDSLYLIKGLVLAYLN